MLALIQVRTAYLQLAGWPGSEVDSVLSDLNQDFVITQTLCSLPCLFMVFVSEG